MAKKTVASLHEGSKEGRTYTKVIKMVKSPKTGAYVFDVEMVPNEKSSNAYGPNIGLQIWDSVKTGWFMLENIVSFLVVLWPFALLGFLGLLGYKKFFK